MNKQIELFNQLVELTKTNEAFYKQEFKLDNSIYWIFNYRLATYTDFLAPGAMWCRGTMFEVTETGEFIRLASLPMPKFWNLNETLHTMNLDLDQIDWIEVKSDGSLISTFIHNGELRLKSKGSLFSEQAIDAMKWLDKPENALLKNLLYTYSMIGYTVNMEYVSIRNRVVISYPEEKLIVLNSMDTELINWGSRHSTWTRFGSWMNLSVSTNPLTKKEFIESVPDMTENIEGFVFVMVDGQRVKVKTNKYKKLHALASDVRSPKKLYEAVIMESIDDIFSLFDDPVIRQIAENCQTAVSHIYNHLVATVEKFHSDNKHLDRKSFAILAQGVLQHHEFGLVMQIYVGRSVDYKAFMLKNYDLFKAMIPTEPVGLVPLE